MPCDHPEGSGVNNAGGTRSVATKAHPCNLIQIDTVIRYESVRKILGKSVGLLSDTRECTTVAEAASKPVSAGPSSIPGNIPIMEYGSSFDCD